MTLQKVVGEAEKVFPQEMDGYFLGQVHSVQEKIEHLANDYRISVLKRMIPLNHEHLDPKHPKFHKLPDDLIVSIKRDGGYNALYYDDQTEPHSLFINQGGRAIYNLPVNKIFEHVLDQINENVEPLKKLLTSFNKKTVFKSSETIHDLIIAGEMFANIQKPGDRPRVFDYLKLLRNPENKKDLENLHYEVFDVLSMNDVDLLDLSYEYRIQLCSFLFPRIKGKENFPIKVVEYQMNVKARDLQELYEKWVVKEHHEGLVIRTKYNMAYKVKPRFDIDAVIIGFSEMLQEDLIEGKEAISSILTAVMRNDGTYQELARVGGGLTQVQREQFHALLKDDIIPSDYKATMPDGRAYHFVRPKQVIQIIYSDILDETASGQPIEKMALQFDNDTYKIIRSVPFVALISPRYEILRTEVNSNLYPSLEFANVKTPTYYDVNIKQITDLVPIPTFDRLKAEQELPESEIFLRLVFKSKWAGVESVKKFLLVSTNKHELDPTYPNFLLYYADYQYYRSVPLLQDVYPFNSLDKALKQLNFLFLRPDNPGEGFLNTTEDGIKRSIILPPHDFYLHSDIEKKLSNSLDEVIKTNLL